MDIIIMESMSTWSEDQIQQRLNEINIEEKEIFDLKKQNKLSNEDIEDVSDNYQYNLEWNYALSELRDERKYLIQLRNKFHEIT